MTSNGNIYLLQFGSFINRDVMNENIKELDNYVVYEYDNKFYVHVGAYINLDTALKMQTIFKNANIYTYIKNDYLSDSKIIEKIKDIDNEILNEDDYHKIMEKNNEILDILKNDVS